jgi:hypothetical protein
MSSEVTGRSPEGRPPVPGANSRHRYPQKLKCCHPRPRPSAIGAPVPLPPAAPVGRERLSESSHGQLLYGTRPPSGRWRAAPAARSPGADRKVSGARSRAPCSLTEVDAVEGPCRAQTVPGAEAMGVVRSLLCCSIRRAHHVPSEDIVSAWAALVLQRSVANPCARNRRGSG